MAYVVVAYGLVAVALVAYGLHLVRERRGLRRSLGQAPDPDRGWQVDKRGASEV